MQERITEVEHKHLAVLNRAIVTENELTHLKTSINDKDQANERIS